MSNSADIKPDELARRLLYSASLPMVHLARHFRVSLREAQGWMQLAYFHELRRAGLTLREASSMLDVSMRKAALLSRSLKENFFRPESEFELPRHLEYMLWAEPLGRLRIHQLLRSHPVAEIDAAIALLVDENRIREVGGRSDVFETTGREARLVSPQWMAQIDGVNDFGLNFARTIRNRVIEHAGHSLYRTLSFRMRQSDIPKLKKFYEESLFPFLASLESDADEGDALSMSVSICWSPESNEEK